MDRRHKAGGRVTMTGRCRKIRYRTMLDAKMALARTRSATASKRRNERRAYHCPDCHGWHLTSLG